MTRRKVLQAWLLCLLCFLVTFVVLVVPWWVLLLDMPRWVLWGPKSSAVVPGSVNGTMLHILDDGMRPAEYWAPSKQLTGHFQRFYIELPPKGPARVLIDQPQWFRPRQADTWYHGPPVAEPPAPASDAATDTSLDDPQNCYVVDISWQYAGSSVLVPMRLECFVYAEVFRLRKSGTMLERADRRLATWESEKQRLQQAMKAHWDAGGVGVTSRYYRGSSQYQPPLAVRQALEADLSSNFRSIGMHTEWRSIVRNAITIGFPLLGMFITFLLARTMKKVLAARRHFVQVVKKGLCPSRNYSVAELPVREGGTRQCPECGIVIEGLDEPTARA